MTDTADVSRGCRGYEENHVQNWCGNISFGSKQKFVPSTVEELQQVVRDAAPPLRVIGRGHSFSPVAECAGGTLVSLARLNLVLDFQPPSDGSVGSITVQGGTTYSEIAKYLAVGRRGALRNLPSCPQFTVAGAIATGTHGSGVHIPNLAADVSMLEFVRADGTLVRYSRETDAATLEGCRVHLGCLGVVSELRLDVVPFFEVDARTYADVPLEAAVRALPELWTRCDSLSVWTSGFGRGGAEVGDSDLLKLADPFPRLEPLGAAAPLEAALLGESGYLLERPMGRYCSDVDAPTTYSPTRREPWHSALSLTLDDQAEETSMAVVDLQAEFFVPLERATEALRAVWAASAGWAFGSPPTSAERVKGLVKGDKAWLSPAPVDSLGIHVSFNADLAVRDEVMAAVPALEAALAPFGARFHWGKLSCLRAARVAELYGEGLEQFRSLCDDHDREGKFRNDHVSELLWRRAAPEC
ncbi:FAD binding domain protein [Emiliania huxleyi CCMP1516]|uniref:FAD-binding PCMH-type domain-containing protein n=2 Tax=Emiliania huxleyi TaxID=2903 RepID=A0A0D3KUR3_EMIH1|nr:FAD binding domain protein [Emiliania huxleyi CCMP1516]EOD39498.1 FAD binding domain protein [Emiliania huxleyi CCMP1516]|eukprot:XP_005791927.1 FAD binding domain protein [Emiliania huxleyi CCMP1516]